MKYFDWTPPTPAENLACDEALLDLAEEGAAGEVLRFWEPATPFVVLGYANHAEREVNLAACRAAHVPVLRRCSGGGTVLQGPGCLNYSLILRIAPADISPSTALRAPSPPMGEKGGMRGSRVATNHPLQSIAGTNKFVLQQHQLALEPLLKRPVRLQGHTDLSVNDLKFSGNAQRRKKHFLIFHGTFLLQFDLALMEQFLPLPSKQPFYRHDRSHAAFLANLNLPAAEVKAALRAAWDAREPMTQPPIERILELVQKKYSTDEWNLKF